VNPGEALEDQQLEGWRNSLWTPLLEKCGKQRAWQEATGAGKLEELVGELGRGVHHQQFCFNQQKI
jgi:hypothetical protein